MRNFMPGKDFWIPQYKFQFVEWMAKRYPQAKAYRFRQMTKDKLKETFT